ncbi:hypothetical protein ACFY7Y_14430 [Streptomyces virginiae]|uniref:hypothetical protein n=1 Tax=Streptomyces virginiae TaxID=1961 RepID=UPI0036C41C6D
MTDQPTLRDLALDAARQAIREGQWWLPPAGQEQLVDAIAAVYQTDLAARLDRILTDIDHHRAAATMSAAKHPDEPALGQAHDGMAAGLHIAAAHIARGNPELVARVKQRIAATDQSAADPAAGYCPHCGRGDAGPTAEGYEELRQRAARDAAAGRESERILQRQIDRQAAELDRLQAMERHARGARPLRDIQGRCPACRGASLFLADGNYITCSRLDCPDPDAASRLLGPGEYVDPNPTIPSIPPPALRGPNWKDRP